MHKTPQIYLFFGSWHPLLVHLPIGMLAVLAFLELLALFPRFKNANASAGFILALATPLAVVTAICGWLLSLGGGYEENLLAWHKWMGISTATGAVMMSILFWRRKYKVYQIGLFVTVTLLMVTGHLGGSLTHGSDYLTRYAPWLLKPAVSEKKKSPTISAKKSSQLSVFAGTIAPILESKCVSCHGAEKSKADLRLDTFDDIMKGGEDGIVIHPGSAAQSLLLQRVLLPEDDDDHMPPEGKPQLTSDEIRLLKWWVESGASENKPATELQPIPADL